MTRGNSDIYVVYRRQLYLFACESQRTLFRDDPDRDAPVSDGPVRAARTRSVRGVVISASNRRKYATGIRKRL